MTPNPGYKSNIAGSALALHSGKAYVQSQCKGRILTHNDIKIHEIFQM